MRMVVACGAAVFLFLLGVAVIAPEAAGGVSLFLGLASFLLFVAAVLGLINPRLLGLPNRLGSVGVWFASAIVFSTAVALHPSPSQQRAVESEAGPPLIAEPLELLAAFEENEIRAVRTYGARPIQITGAVASIEEGTGLFGDGGSIVFADGDFFQRVTAGFSNVDPLLALSRRDVVTVLCQDTDGGNVRGAAIHVSLHDCELVSVVDNPAR